MVIIKIDELIEELENVKEERGDVGIYKIFEQGSAIKYKRPDKNQEGIKITDWVQELEEIDFGKEFFGVIYDPSDGKLAFF